MILEECKHEVKEKKMNNLINYELHLDGSEDETGENDKNDEENIID